MRKRRLIDMVTWNELRTALPKDYVKKQFYSYKNIVFYYTGKAIHVLSIKYSNTLGVIFISDNILNKSNLLEFKEVYKICLDSKALAEELANLKPIILH